jgi:predicted aconitase with swiveling domain
MEMSDTIRLYGRTLYPGKVTAEALVSTKPLEGFANVNPAKGYTTERNHPLFKIPYTGKVLVYPSARGSGGFLMYGMGGEAKAAAFIHTENCPLNVAAAAAAHIPAMTEFDRDPVSVIETGDTVFVNADEGYIEITKK